MVCPPFPGIAITASFARINKELAESDELALFTTMPEPADMESGRDGGRWINCPISRVAAEVGKTISLASPSRLTSLD